MRCCAFANLLLTSDRVMLTKRERNLSVTTVQAERTAGRKLTVLKLL
jgi:hypothetical protein